MNVAGTMLGWLSIYYYVFSLYVTSYMYAVDEEWVRPSYSCVG